MELRWTLCSAMLLLALVSRSSVYGHVLDKREAEDDYGEFQADGAGDDDTLNDGDGEQDDTNVSNAIILTPPKTYEVASGESVTLECEVSPQNNTVVQWIRDTAIYFLGNIKVQANERLTLNAATGAMTLKNVQPSDEGEYECNVVQDIPQQIKHRVVITSKPVIRELTATNGGTVVEGSTLVLNCDVIATPPPQILWSRQKKGQNKNERLRENDAIFNKNTMTIEHVKSEHSGEYFCYVFNGFGHAQATIDITVIYKPRVHVHKTTVNSKAGVAAILQCTAHGEPEPHIFWYKDGKSIVDDMKYRVVNNHSYSELSFVPRIDDDFGTYICVAKNSHGKHNKSMELVQRPVVEDTDADGPKLSWTVHSHQDLEQVELQLMDLSGDGNNTIIRVPLPQTKANVYEMTHEVKGLAPGKYEVVVKAKNAKGWSRETKHVVIEFEKKPMSIQRSSVFGSGSTTISQSAALLSTTIMYLLVRTL
ncbi:protein amalgam [Aphomia sociella]